MLPVTLAQTVLAPVIEQLGNALTIWVKLGEVLVLKLASLL